MKLKIETSELQYWLNITTRACSSISTNPILNYILISAYWWKLTLIWNNLNIAITHSLQCDFVDSGWSFCVPSIQFNQYISFINDKTVEIELIEKEWSIKISTKNGSIKIKWFPLSDFPIIPVYWWDFSSFTIESKILIEALSKTIHTVSDSKIMPNLAGVNVTVWLWWYRFCSTDWHRLTKVEVKKQEITEKENVFCETIPTSSCRELMNIIPPTWTTSVKVYPNNIEFSFWNTKLYSSVISWKFPDVDRFFIAEKRISCILNSKDLKNVLKKVSIISKSNVEKAIDISFWEKSIKIETVDTQSWYAVENIPCEIESSIWEVKVRCNSEYLMNSLSIVTWNVVIWFENNQSQIFIYPLIDDELYDIKHLFMPIKVKN